MKVISASLFCLVILFPESALALDWKDLMLDGYYLAEKTQVRGEYKGCTFDAVIPLEDGLAIVCQSYSYKYEYNPTVIILRTESGQTKIIIDNEEVDGRLVRQQ